MRPDASEPTADSGSADDPEGARPLARRARHPNRRTLRIVSLALVGVLALAAGGTLYVYRQLNSNIRSAPLSTGVGVARPTAEASTGDPFEGRAFNVLVIGSDSRTGKENCRLGGACESGTNADVEMVVHVARDRTNATVMSVPRDTVTDLPGCEDSSTGSAVAARFGQINSTLAYGPGCTVAAIEKLTGIAIDHFVLIDFAGVIKMSDAVGGADLCVDRDVYDTKSHLKLSKGDHTITGQGALEFVRTRHAFGDGSDLGRTYAQHLYLSAVIRKLKSTGVLLNPVSVYQVAQEATKALTVDPGLASITQLVKLGAVIGRVPEKRITFVTMQTGPDPADANRVVPAAAAQDLFDAIMADRSLTVAGTTTASPTASPGPSATSSASPSGSASPQPAKRTREALAGANASTADEAGSCAKVSTGRVVEYAGRLLTPQQAYAAATSVPDSAE